MVQDKRLHTAQFLQLWTKISPNQSTDSTISRRKAKHLISQICKVLEIPYKSTLEELLDLDIYTIWNFYDVLFDSNVPLADSLQMLSRREKQPLTQRQQSFQTRIRSSISDDKLGDTGTLVIQSTDTIFPRFMAQVQTLFPDLLLVCAEGIRVNAHRAVLATASPKLMTAITLATNDRTPLPLELSFPDLAPAAVEMCLNFIYTGTLLLTAPCLRSVRQAADSLGFVELTNQATLLMDRNPATPSTPEFGSVRGRPRQLPRTGTQFLHSLSKSDPRVKVFETVCDSAFSLVNQKGKVCLLSSPPLHIVPFLLTSPPFLKRFRHFGSDRLKICLIFLFL